VPDSIVVDEDNAWGAPAAGPGGSPALTLDGFAGPLDHLLALARAQKIDLAALSLVTLLDQLTAALRQAPASVPLGQKGIWVVMAAWLVQLRARLLLPADPAAQQDAAAEADQLRDRLVGLEETQALVGWLERRPQLGHDVFVRGHPPSHAQSSEVFGVSADAAQAIDVIEFLWASLALFDDDAGEPDTTSVYRPPLRHELHTVADARERILRQLAELPEGGPLEQFLPKPPEAAEGGLRQALRQRSAWSSTFIASLELVRQGEAALQQEKGFTAINVSSPTSRTNGSGGPQ
jgi:segregation and condensation protein A